MYTIAIAFESGSSGIGNDWHLVLSGDVDDFDDIFSTGWIYDDRMRCTFNTQLSNYNLNTSNYLPGW